MSRIPVPGLRMRPEDLSSSSLAWHVYILECCDGSLYTGVTTDMKRRLVEHNSTPRGARYTRARRPVVLVYAEEHFDRQAACRAEARIKRLSRAGKQQLISTIHENTSSASTS